MYLSHLDTPLELKMRFLVILALVNLFLVNGFPHPHFIWLYRLAGWLVWTKNKAFSLDLLCGFPHALHLESRKEKVSEIEDFALQNQASLGMSQSSCSLHVTCEWLCASRVFLSYILLTKNDRSKAWFSHSFFIWMFSGNGFALKACFSSFPWFVNQIAGFVCPHPKTSLFV